MINVSDLENPPRGRHERNQILFFRISSNKRTIKLTMICDHEFVSAVWIKICS